VSRKKRIDAGVRELQRTSNLSGESSAAERRPIRFDAYEEEHWDRQIERDQKVGPLRHLMERARADFGAGKCTRL